MNPLQECQALLDLARLAQEQNEPGLFITPEMLEVLVRRTAAGIMAVEMTKVLTKTGSGKLTASRLIIDLAGIQGVYEDICTGQLDVWAREPQSPSSAALEATERTLASTTSPSGSSTKPSGSPGS